jgi:trans-aconitate 2-methyltransferase
LPWDPDRYHQFREERSAPFEDLFSLVAVRPGLQAIDLGCGTGELTRQLADRLPDSQVTGIDSSEEMLRRAEAQARPGLRFALGRIEETGGEWDLVFSHAALHWVEDHTRLVPRLMALLRRQGQLAVQMPSNHGHYTHTAILETAGEGPFYAALGGWTRQPPVLPIDAYADLLYANGGREIVVFEKVYSHLLDDADALADWTSGTALVPYFERLPKALHEDFMRRYRQRLWDRWPAGPVYYGFRRTLFSARKGDD